MKKYVVYVEEILRREEEIVAESKEKAIEELKKKYYDEEIVLDNSYWYETNFDCCGSLPLDFGEDEEEV